MAKRFIDTGIFKQQFMKSLSTVHKLFFFYLITNCDHSGIWDVEIDVATIRVGEKISEEELLRVFKDKIIVFDDGKKWFIPSFVHYQYGELNDKVNAHKSVISNLKKQGLLQCVSIKDKQLNQQLGNSSLNSSLTVMDKDKDKDIYKDNGILNRKNVYLIQREIDWLKENHSYDASEEISYLTSLNNKLKKKREETGRTTQDEDIFQAFCFFIDHKPEWFNFFSIKALDNNFESLQKSIKDKIEEESKEFHPTIERI